MNNCLGLYNEWLESPVFDPETKKELEALKENDAEIFDRFYKELEFGTAGLRGVIGAGLNRMNSYTVGKATQGLANYIIKQNGKTRGVAIAYDSRHMSKEFADTAALCLNANGIRAFVFESLRPTPELSFAVRLYNCIAGINITASHNPPEYNGYKVYWEDGAQITPPHDTGITEEVKNITDFSVIKTMEKAEAKKQGLYIVIGEETDDLYIENVKAQVKCPEAVTAEGKNITIVYTPLHGTGNIPARRVLKEIGFDNVFVVKEQEMPDGDFPTVDYPNPEDKKAFTLALKLAEEKNADLVLANDPDADRLGVYVRDEKGIYHALTGNMSGALILEYTLNRLMEKGPLNPEGEVIKSIVTTNLVNAIAKSHNVKLVECLTGFKWIGKEILRMENEKKGEYLFGLEESYGCLLGTYARDKDAIVASMALCEAAAYFRTRKMNLWDAMKEMYEKYGYYKEDVVSVTMKGADGIKKIGEIMEKLRKLELREIGGKKVTVFKDYGKDEKTDMLTGEKTPIGLPESNVLYYNFDNGEWLSVRPSGTEPKIKLYIGVTGTSEEDAEKRRSIFIGEAVKLLEV